MKLRKCEDVSDELDKMETELQSQASSKQMSLLQVGGVIVVILNV